MTLDIGSEPFGRHWEALLVELRSRTPEAPVALARSLARVLTETELHAVVEELSEQQGRVRGDHFEEALLRARAALARGDLEAARADAEAACRIDFARWEGHCALGEALERTGDRDGALRQYMTATRLGWESEEARQAVRRLK